MAKPHFIESLKETLKQFKDEHRTLAKAVGDIENMLSGMLNVKGAKRRGRPPGKAAATTAKRGRPAKKKVTAVKAKKRGRPPGSKNAVTKKAASNTQRKASARQWTPEQKKAAADRLAKARAAKKAADKAAE